MVAEVCPFVESVQKASVTINKNSSWKCLINIAPNVQSVCEGMELEFLQLHFSFEID